MATLLAEKCHAKCLLLNHFSQRYKPKINENKVDLNKKQEKNDDDDDDNLSVDLLLEQAKQTTSKPVFIADDFFTYIVPLSK